MADWEREQDECQHCGRSRDLCSDPTTQYFPQLSICHSTMEAAGARRIFDEMHGEKSGRQFHDGTRQSWSDHFSRATPYAYDDGATIWMSTEDLDPDNQFLGNPNAAPRSSVEVI